jgi:hydrophobic/amphiphilic exporter-1 (mainly G- bacteria), HAE1 family
MGLDFKRGDIVKKLIRFCLHRPVTIVMAVIGVGIFGIISAFRIETDFLPRIQARRLIVSTSYPGLPAEEIRNMITLPIEDALASVQGIKKMSSLSRQGRSVIELEFQWKMDMHTAASETREVIDIAYANLPDRTEKPRVMPVHGADGPVLRIGVFPKKKDYSGKNLDLARRLCDREIKARLQRIDGVGAVTIKGGWEEEVQVLVDGSKAAGRRLSLSFLHELIRESNIDYPAGTLTDGDIEYLVKTEGKAKSLSKLAELPIPLPGGAGQILLKDIAAVRTGRGEQESFFAGPGGEGIGLMIRRLEGFSPTQLSAHVRQEIDELRKTYDESLDIKILQDRSMVVTKSIQKLLLSAGIGCGIAFGIIFMFLKRAATAAVLALNFPVSIFFCLIALQVFGKNFNIMSIGGLVIGIGMLVDNGIVVLENLQKKVPAPGEREETERRVAEAAAEMAVPTFGATCTTLIVFLPVLFLPGMTGVLYSDLALAVIFSLAGSYFCSSIMIPVFYLFILRKCTAPGKKRIEEIYSRLLAPILRAPVRILPVIIAILGAGAAGVFFVSFRLMPPVHTGVCEITLSLEQGAAMERVKAAGNILRDYLEKSDYIDGFFLHAGASREDIYYLADPKERMGIIHCTAFLTEKGEIEERAAIRRAAKDLSSLFPEASVKMPHPIIAPLLGVDEDFSTIAVSGKDRQEIEQSAELLVSRITRLIPEYSRRDFSLVPGGRKPEVRVLPRRDKLSGTGISLKDITRETTIALTGSVPSKMRTRGRDIDVRLRLETGNELTADELAKLVILTSDGDPAVLGDLAEIQETETQAAFLRENRKDTVQIRTPVEAGRISRLIQETEGTAVSGSSILEEQKQKIGFLFFLAFVLIYLLLGAQFESLLLPLLVVLPILPAVSGVLAALALTGNSLDLNSSLGVIVFLGIGVNNSIILSETYKKGIDRREVEKTILRGSADRVRPVLMTMLTTITALLPAAIDPMKRSGQSGMAAAIIGGLTAAGMITLFIQPFLFLCFYRRRRRGHKTIYPEK